MATHITARAGSRTAATWITTTGQLPPGHLPRRKIACSGNCHPGHIECSTFIAIKAI